MMLSQHGASLFQPVHHHGVNNSVSKYLRARVVLVICFTSIVLLYKTIAYVIKYVL